MSSPLMGEEAFDKNSNERKAKIDLLPNGPGQAWNYSPYHLKNGASDENKKRINFETRASLQQKPDIHRHSP